MFDVVRRIHETAVRLRWRSEGCPLPPPNAVKQGTIIRYATEAGIRVLVETGTYEGRTLRAVRPYFARLYSIELGEDLYRKACARFQSDPKVFLFQGDSGDRLRDILEIAGDQRCLFWLDAHYSRGDTARGSEDTPVLRELHAIAGHSRKDHVILVDDARCFGTDPAYPGLGRMEALAAQLFRGSSFSVSEDIIRIVPSTPPR